MYFEFYLDIYFLENFLLNLLVLELTDHIGGYRVSLFRKIAGAFLGSIGDCLLILTPVHKISFFYGIGQAAVLLCMVLFVFSMKRKQMILQKIWICLLLRLTMEGCMNLLAEYTKLPFIVCMLTGFLFVLILELCRKKSREEEKVFYEVIISYKERRKTFTALLDSGNQLTHPLSGKAVHILDYTIVEELLEEDEKEELEKLLHLQSIEKPSGIFSLIPFRTIGMERGLMPVMVIDTIWIRCGENIKETKDCLAAISKVAVSSTGKYQMILHPDILK